MSELDDLNDSEYRESLHIVRAMFSAMLEDMAQSPGFSGDTNGSFSWRAR
jgi:gamma-glutamylcysteine synthetase